MISTEPVTLVVRSGRAGQFDASWGAEPQRPWQREALCRGMAGDVFFPPDDECRLQRRHREQVAKAICAACPVRLPCASFAFLHREMRGVWGGLSEDDRRRRIAHP